MHRKFFLALAVVGVIGLGVATASTVAADHCHYGGYYGPTYSHSYYSGYGHGYYGPSYRQVHYHGYSPSYHGYHGYHGYQGYHGHHGHGYGHGHGGVSVSVGF